MQFQYSRISIWIILVGLFSAEVNFAAVSNVIFGRKSILQSDLNSTASTGDGLFVIGASGNYELYTDLSPVNVANTNPVILITASNVTLDLKGKSIFAPSTELNKITAAIEIADGVNNVTIRNGVISGIAGSDGITAPADYSGYGILVNKNAATSITHVKLEDLTIFGCGCFGVSISNCNDLTMNNVKCIANGPAYDAATGGTAPYFAGGSCLSNVNIANITNSNFSANAWQALGGGYTPSAKVNIVGMYLNNCTSIKMVDSSADKNTNTTTFSTSAYVGVLTAGVYLTNNTVRCTFINVSACQNSRTQLSATGAGNVYGFYNKNTSINTFDNCCASGNSINGSTNAANPTRTAVGFYSTQGTSNRFVNSSAKFNNISSKSGSNSFAAGIQLGDQVPYTPAIGNGTSNPTVSAEKATMLQSITANYNIAQDTATLASSFGVLILPGNVPFLSTSTVSSKIRIEKSEISFNASQNETVQGVGPGLSYGIADLTPGYIANGNSNAVIGSTTLLRSNISVGHGATFTGGALNSFATWNMNYYLDYRYKNDKQSNAILETSIVNFNNVTNLNNNKLLNVSFYVQP